MNIDLSWISLIVSALVAIGGIIGALAARRKTNAEASTVIMEASLKLIEPLNKKIEDLEEHVCRLEKKVARAEIALRKLAKLAVKPNASQEEVNAILREYEPDLVPASR